MFVNLERIICCTMANLASRDPSGPFQPPPGLILARIFGYSILDWENYHIFQSVIYCIVGLVGEGDLSSNFCCVRCQGCWTLAVATPSHAEMAVTGDSPRWGRMGVSSEPQRKTCVAVRMKHHVFFSLFFFPLRKSKESQVEGCQLKRVGSARIVLAAYSSSPLVL